MKNSKNEDLIIFFLSLRGILNINNEYYRINYRTGYFFGDWVVSSAGDKGGILFRSEKLVDISAAGYCFYGGVCTCGRFDYFYCAWCGSIFFFLEYFRDLPTA